MAATESPPGTTAADLAARFERLPFTGHQRKLVIILATCFGIDGVDLAMLSYLLAPVSSDLGLTKSQAGLAASSVFVGMAVGATIAGVISDRFGRRRVLTVTMLVWGVATLANAFAWDLGSFVTFRVLTGIGLGAELPIAIALVAEFMPAFRRGRSFAWVRVASTASAVVFNLLSLLAVSLAGGALGWRVMFGVMSGTSLFAFVVRRKMPESPRWYVSRGLTGRAEATMRAFERAVERAYGAPLPEPTPIAAPVRTQTPRNPLRALFRRGSTHRTLVAWALWFFALLAYYGITTWVGKLLVDRGVAVEDSIVVGIVVTSAAVPASVLTAYAMDYIGRKIIIPVALLLAGSVAFAYGHAATYGVVILAGIAMGFALETVTSSMYIYTPELFPTHSRGTGLGTASTIGRVSAIAGPLLVPPIVVIWGYTGAFLMFAVSLALAAVLVITFGPETRGKALEEVSG